jgi:hypothetical protein
VRSKCLRSMSLLVLVSGGTPGGVCGEVSGMNKRETHRSMLLSRSSKALVYLPVIYCTCFRILHAV